MDLKAYYQRIREIEQTIESLFAFVVSLETEDGGKSGIVTEVPRRIAAKMIADGSAKIASEKEAATFLEQQAEALRIAKEQAAAQKVQLSVLPTSELNQLRAAVKTPRT